MCQIQELRDVTEKKQFDHIVLTKEIDDLNERLAKIKIDPSHKCAKETKQKA